MCLVIDSEVVLANLLNKKDECTFSDLISFKVKFESELNNVYVDISQKSVFSSICYYSNWFFWNNGKIEKAKNTENYKNNLIDLFFNNKLDPSIKVSFINAIEKL